MFLARRQGGGQAQLDRDRFRLKSSGFCRLLAKKKKRSDSTIEVQLWAMKSHFYVLAFLLGMAALAVAGEEKTGVEKAVGVATGAAVGVGAVLAAPAILGTVFSIAAAGPVAGGLFAAMQSAVGPLAAGGVAATIQSMTGVVSAGGVAVGGTVGGVVGAKV